MMGMGRHNDSQGDSNKEELELHLSNIPAGAIIEDENHEIVYMNNLMARMFGNQVGNKCYEVLMGVDKPCNPCSVDEIIKKGKQHLE